MRERFTMLLVIALVLTYVSLAAFIVLVFPLSVLVFALILLLVFRRCVGLFASGAMMLFLGVIPMLEIAWMEQSGFQPFEEIDEYTDHLRDPCGTREAMLLISLAIQITGGCMIVVWILQKKKGRKEKMEKKKKFEDILKATGRVGVGNVLAELDRLGFYAAPASTRFHGAHPGGLLQHSLNVYDEAMLVREMQLRMKPEIEARLPPDSIAIAALLHDVCKAEVYKPEQKSRKNSNGEWERYNGYRADYSGFPLGHGEKSVIRLLRWGLEMSDDEIIAIRWHMSGFDLAFQSPEIRSSYGEASDKCPLLAVLRAADGLASHILET